MDTNTYKAIFSTTAIYEMRQNYQYIKQKLYAHKAAERLMKLVQQKVENLKFLPKMHTQINLYDDMKKQYRRIVVNNYVILYTIDELLGAVYISHMYYSRRNYLY